MKENNLNRVIGWSGLLLTSLLSTSALADNIGTSAEELGLSDYRHFVIYPRLDKALKAQKNNDEATAIREFEYIHQQVPDNIPLTLYLAEAYRHFGHDDQARLLLEDQLKRHPGDARLERSLAAIPVEVKSVTTVEELLAQQKACDAAPTLRCRSEVGQNALRLAQLPVARAQLNDATFAASPEGKTLRTDLLQRAIYLKQWSQADTLYNEARQQNTLSAAERRQWFDVLLASSWTIGSWRCNHRGSSPILSHILLTRPRWLIVAKKHASSIISLKIRRYLPRTHKRKVGSICYLNTAATPFRRWRIIRYSLPTTASMLLARRYRCC